MCSRRAALVALLAVCIASTGPLYGDEAGKKYAYAAGLVEDAAGKMHCMRAAAAMEKWQAKLKIQDWELSLSCSVPREFADVPGFHGATRMNTTARKAEVYVNPLSPRDPEEIVIHELLHIVQRVVVESSSALAEEQAVWMLSMLLYEGRHK